MKMMNLTTQIDAKSMKLIKKCSRDLRGTSGEPPGTSGGFAPEPPGASLGPNLNLFDLFDNI